MREPLTERRTRIDAAGPIATSTWRWDGRGFTGKIEWKRCRIDMTWKESQETITSERPGVVTGALVVAAGAAMAIAGFAMYDWDGVEKKCVEPGVCYNEDVSNTLPSTMAIGGGLIVGGGLSLTKLPPRVEVKKGGSRQTASSETGACFQPTDLGQLKLVLQVADKKFITIPVERDWSARIEIPAEVELPRNVDLPVLIYHVPREARTLVGRWHIIGHARAPSDGTSAADLPGPATKPPSAERR